MQECSKDVLVLAAHYEVESIHDEGACVLWCSRGISQEFDDQVLLRCICIAVP